MQFISVDGAVVGVSCFQPNDILAL